MNTQHINEFKSKIDQFEHTDDFFCFFNNSQNVDSSFIKGFWDFTYHIANPCMSVINNPEEMVVLEIGHGGGRLLNSASHFFKNVIGIDVHNQSSLVQNELNKRGCFNIGLVQSCGYSIPLKDNSIDAVYSFIVFQHLRKIEIFNNYLEEAYRVLKPGGIAIIYFGRAYYFFNNPNNRALYFLDRIYEFIKLNNKYKEFDSEVNHINLLVSPKYAKSIAIKIGFKIIKGLVSKKHLVNKRVIYGGQSGLILRKI